MLRPTSPAPIDLEALAAQAGVPFLDAPNPSHVYLLCWSGKRLEVRSQAGGSAIRVDFLEGRPAARWRSTPSRSEPLIRAVGIGRGTETVVDVSAGLGRDAYSMARCGAEVLAVERSPIVAALLEDGLKRFADACASDRSVVRIRLRCADARDVLAELGEEQRPDAVYLDPMLAHRNKSAQVKKELQLLRALLGEDGDAGELLALARRTARRRTVVKRPLRAPPLAADPDVQWKSTRARWDVYLSGRTEPGSVLSLR